MLHIQKDLVGRLMAIWEVKQFGKLDMAKEIGISLAALNRFLTDGMETRMSTLMKIRAYISEKEDLMGINLKEGA